MIEIRPSIRQALAERRPVVALESTVVSHGLPWPRSLETALEMEQSVRREGATPATIGIVDGSAIVGLTPDELRILARSDDVRKVSRRDLSAIVGSGRTGGTTVAATAFIAERARIRFFATGGIGGVHRGAELSFDISADLTELARTPVVVICAGAKAILDLPRTLEMLETLGVPVVGYRCDRFPAFYCRDSGLALELRVDSPEEAARLVDAHLALGLDGGIVFAQPPPADSALDEVECERWIEAAVGEAEAGGIGGKDLTPWLLERLVEASSGRTLEANIALLLANARLAARIAVARDPGRC